MRPPLLWIAAAFAGGVWLGLDPPVGWPAALLALIAGVPFVARRAPVAAACALVLAAGIGWGGAARRERARTCAGRWSAPPLPAAPPTRAAVVRLLDAAPADGAMVDGVVVAGACRGRLRLRWPARRPARGGTEWVVAGPWLGPPGAAGRGLLRARRVRLLDDRARGRGAVRGAVSARITALFGGQAPLVDALILARRAELAPELRERFTRAGLAHLLAISGLHVGFIAAWLGLLLRRLRLPRRWQFAAGTGLIGAYVWLLGAPAPAVRAALMLASDGAARLRERVVAPRGTMGLTVLLLVAVDPWAVRSVGAWLSVSAVAAVIWAGRVAQRAPRAIRLVLPAAAATLATAPITAFAFGTVAPVGVVANLVAIPLGALAVPGLFLAVLTSWVAPPVATLFAAGAGLALALLDQVAAFAARVPGGHVIQAAGWPAAALWAAVVTVAWWLWQAQRRPWLAAARLAFVATLLAWTSLAAPLLFNAVRLDACRCLTVSFLNVGQGDAVVLRTPAGRWVVVDGGPRGPGGDAGRRVVVPFLRRRGVTRLALLVASHGDGDHVGGLPAVLEAFRPSLVLEPGEPLGRPLYLEWLAAVEANAARWVPARSGDRLELDGIALEVLSPDAAWVGMPLDANEHSVVLRVSYGATRLLLVGDAGLPVERRLRGRVGRVDVLKVGHHGSRTATSEAWLSELAPGLAVISVGARNTYGHPAGEVLERLGRHGIAVLRTDRDGTVTWTSDGQIQRTHPDVPRHDRALHHGAGAPVSRGDGRAVQSLVRHLPRGQDHHPQRAPRRALRRPRRRRLDKRAGRGAAKPRRLRQRDGAQLGAAHRTDLHYGERGGHGAGARARAPARG